MSGCKAVGRAVEAYIKLCLAFIYETADLVFIGDLSHKASGLKFFV